MILHAAGLILMFFGIFQLALLNDSRCLGLYSYVVFTVFYYIIALIVASILAIRYLSETGYFA